MNMKSVLLFFFTDDPSCDDKIQGNPHKTVFVGRLVSVMAALVISVPGSLE